jgi:hypothetical protein
VLVESYKVRHAFLWWRGEWRARRLNGDSTRLAARWPRD